MQVSLLLEAVERSPLLVLVIPILGAIVGLMFVKAVPQFRSMHGKIDRINHVLREQIMGVRVIRAFRRTRYEQERFQSANADLTNTTLHVNRLFVLAFPALMGVMNLTTIAVGGRIVEQGSHSELLKRGGVYDALYKSQFTEVWADTGQAPDAGAERELARVKGAATD